MKWTPPLGATAKERISLRDPVWVLKGNPGSHSSWVYSLDSEVCPENAPFYSFHPQIVSCKLLDKFLKFQPDWSCCLKWNYPEAPEAGEAGMVQSRAGRASSSKAASGFLALMPWQPCSCPACVLTSVFFSGVWSMRAVGLFFLWASHLLHFDLAPLDFLKLSFLSWLEFYKVYWAHLNC